MRGFHIVAAVTLACAACVVSVLPDGMSRLPAGQSASLFGGRDDPAPTCATDVLYNNESKCAGRTFMVGQDMARCKLTNTVVDMGCNYAHYRTSVVCVVQQSICGGASEYWSYAQQAWLPLPGVDCQAASTISSLYDGGCAPYS